MTVHYTSSFKEPLKRELPPPSVPLTPSDVAATVLYNASAVEPARQITVSIALVDTDFKLSPYSAIQTLTLPHGGGFWLEPWTFCPNNPEVLGYVINISGKLAIVCEGGTSPLDMAWLPTAWKAIGMALVTPYPVLDIRRTAQTAPKGGTSGKLTTPAPRPTLNKYGVPGTDLALRYAWLTESGESELSPPCVSKGPVGYPVGGVTYRRFNMPGVEVPPGAWGYRVYAETPKGLRRAGDFSIDCMQPLLTTLTSSGPGTVNPKVTLSRRQQALDEARAGDTVVVDLDEELTCPLIDRDPGNGATRQGIQVTGPQGGPFRVDYKGPGDVALLMQNRHTFYGGMHLRGGWLSSSDHSGGQAFGCHWWRCTFEHGMRTLRTSARQSIGGNDDHTASEWFMENCTSGAILIQGTQSANHRFYRTHVYGDYEKRQGSACVTVETACKVSFEGGLFAERATTFLNVGGGARVDVTDLFSDDGWLRLCRQISYTPPEEIRIQGNQINRLERLGMSASVVKLERVKSPLVGPVVPVPMLTRVANAVKRVFRRKAA